MIDGKQNSRFLIFSNIASWLALGTLTVLLFSGKAHLRLGEIDARRLNIVGDQDQPLMVIHNFSDGIGQAEFLEIGDFRWNKTKGRAQSCLMKHGASTKTPQSFELVREIKLEVLFQLSPLFFV